MIRRITAPGSKMTFIGILALFLILGFSNLASAGGSYHPDEIFGKWQGFLDPQDIRMDLVVTAGGADLDYGPDRSCSAWAEYVRLKDDTHIYRLREKQGGSLQGWCDKLRDGKMTLTPLENGTLELHIAVESKGIDETAKLEKKE